MVTLNINGSEHQVEAENDVTLLWVLREKLGLTGTRFGCGVAMCGACTVHVDGEPVFACQTFASDLEGAIVTSIEGLSENGDHPLQKAWIAEQVPQCGYCQSGQIMRAAALLAGNPTPSQQEIVDYMSPNLCRCGTYSRIQRAIERAAKEV